MANSEVSMATPVSDWIQLLRPKQWVKNAFVLAPVLFAGRAGDLRAVLAALLAAALFSLLASGIYAMNDAYDAKSDREHPRKRLRPIAAGRIDERTGLFVGGVLALVAVGGAWLLEPRFGLIALSYVVVNVLYTLKLKEVVILDVFAVASFFLMRLLSGAAVVEVEPSIWLLICGGLLALYLGFAKRRNELVTLGAGSSKHREVLTKYGAEFLDQMSAVLLSVTVVSYLMYTLTSETAQRVGSDVLSYSVVFVLYGVFRYLYLSHRHGEGGDPSETLLTDRPLMGSVIVWFAYCGWVIYLAG
ncbi:MAG: decaprenyl-phosphate phosphoribosyltransferase [Longimicrobiales bacterium]